MFSFLFGIAFAQTNQTKLLADTTLVCSGDSFLIKFPDERISKAASFQWVTPYSLIYNTKQLYVKSKGKYMVKIVDGKKTYYDTTYLKVIEKPKLKLSDTTICGGNSLIINLKNKNYKYNWSTGETSENIKIEKAGTYWVKISQKGCVHIDTFKVNTAVGVVPNFGKEVLICDNEPNKTLSVKAPGDVKLFWNNGSITPNITVTKEGLYWVKSISKNCGSKTDSVTVKYKSCDCEIFIPNSFTPNDDEKNDYFAPVFQCEYSYFMFMVQDRWGNTVYTTNSVNGKWDGKFKGYPCPDDVYVYHLEAIQKSGDKKIVKNGHISLFR